MESKCSIKRTTMIVGIIAIVSISAVAQENRSEISIQGTGFFTKDTDGMGFSNTLPTRADFWLAIATTLTAGSQPRRTTATTATHNSISAAHRPASRLTSTKSLAQLW